MKHNLFTSTLGDKDFDLDGAKVTGAMLLAVAVIGFFIGKPGWETMLYTGAGMILGKCIRENT